MGSVLVLLGGAWIFTAALGLIALVVLAVFYPFGSEDWVSETASVLLGWLLYWPLLVPTYLAGFVWYAVYVLPSRKYKE